MAFERLGDKRAADVLAAVLMIPGMRGHARKTLTDAAAPTGHNAKDKAERTESLRELVLARALFRCGDKGGLGENILREYAQDLRGHYARHATAVLSKFGET